MGKTVALLIGLGIITGAVAWTLQAGTKLFVNGELSSSRVIDRNGVAYVPLRDVAAGLKMNLTKTTKGWEMNADGGANAVTGVNGKVGDTLWNGAFRFQVIEVIRGKTYTNRYSGDKQVVTPYPAENDLVVVVCRVKNGLKEANTVLLPAGALTGLTDDKERSYAPRNGLSMDCPTRGADLLPGAAVEFALTFDVPADAKLKDLVYEVYYIVSEANKKKPFRVKLSE